MNITWSIWMIFILLEAYRNWYIIKNYEVSPDHLIGFVIRLAFGVVLSAISTNSIYDFAILLLCLGLVFWPLFDFSLNILRGKPLFYIGRTAWIDKHTRPYKAIAWFGKLSFALTAYYLSTTL